MGKIVVLILVLLAIGLIWSLPLYISGNFVLWLFRASFRLTLLQSFGLCLLITVITSMFFKDKEGK